MCMFLGLQKWQCLPHYLIFIAICIKNESDCHKQMLRFRHLHSGPMSILFSYRNAVRVTCSDVMWLVALKRFPLCSVVPRNKAIGCTPSVDHRCREGQQLGWDDYEYEELDIDSAWIFFVFAGKEDETKHLLHLTPSQQLNVVRWNPASQNEVWIQYLFYLCFIWMLTAYQKKDVSKTLWCLIPCLAELSLFNCCNLFSCWKQKILA